MQPITKFAKLQKPSQKMPLKKNPKNEYKKTWQNSKDWRSSEKT